MCRIAPDCSKLAINRKNDSDVTVSRHDVVVNFFCCFVFLVKFSFWSKFHVSIITGSGIITIFFYKGLTRNLEIGNTPVLVLPNIWRLVQVLDTKFGTNVSNKIWCKISGLQLLPFFELLRENQLDGGGDYLPPPRLGLTNKPKPKKNKRFSQKTLTIHPICSNCDAFDKKLKIYILLVCHNQHILVAVPILNISNLLSTCDKNDKLMCSDFF